MSDVFHFLTDDDLRLLAEKAKRMSFAAGELLLSEGQESAGIYVLRSGRVRVQKRAISPRRIIATLEPGEVFGEVSFIDNQRVSASVVAIEPTEVDLLGKSEVISLLSSVPGLSSRFYQSLALKLSERLRATTDDLAHL